MTDFSLTLGPVAFAGFELPSSITLGGRQRLAIHRLPGGVRIIDALGPDPADLAWSGIFTGPDAAERARALDLLRTGGQSLPLAWDAFLYTVVIEQFEADYRSPWWIPYRLSCSVLRDEAAAAIQSVASIVTSLSADLAAVSTTAASSAAALSSAAAAAIVLPGAVTAGTAAYALASTALAATIADIDQRISATQPGMQTTNLASAVQATGLLAQLTAARAYARRAARNLYAAGT